MGKKHEHEHEHEYHISIPPTTKTSVLGAINMLGLAKRQFVALRYFNAAGADPDAELGALRDPETHLIPRAMMSSKVTSVTSRCLAATTRRPTEPQSGITSTSRI